MPRNFLHLAALSWPEQFRLSPGRNRAIDDSAFTARKCASAERSETSGMMFLANGDLAILRCRWDCATSDDYSGETSPHFFMCARSPILSPHYPPPRPDIVPRARAGLTSNHSSCARFNFISRTCVDPDGPRSRESPFLRARYHVRRPFQLTKHSAVPARRSPENFCSKELSGLPNAGTGFLQHLSSRVLRIGSTPRTSRPDIASPRPKNIGDLGSLHDTHQEQARGKGRWWPMWHRFLARIRVS